jgi:type II secretory pathway pseudopilin PulG
MSLSSRYSQAIHQRRIGFTLIEALIAITMTLVIMLALAQGFKRLSDDISKGRARLALSDQLRGVSEILRNDLAGLTVETDPTSKATKSGYFLYYEGPLADHHPVTCPINSLPGGTPEQQLSTSKYGDFDDVLMFTARAKGEWFRGRVPLAIVKGAAAGLPVGTNYPGYVDDDWLRTVVVASEYAEIAYFMMPSIVPTLNGAATPYEEYAANLNSSLTIVDRDSPVNPSPTPAMPGYFTATGNAIPDGFKLCRRVLLILPNLNLPAGQLFAGGTLAPSIRLLANPVTTSLGSRRMLENAYQRCDLSVHRVPSPLANAPIAANTLEDLANPLNRFAHVTLPGPVIGGPPESRSMPILSLTGPLPLQQYALDPNISLAARSDSTFPECGFIRPEFLKRTFDPTTGLVATTENPENGNDVEVLSNEEVLSTNCIAFDLKGYDPIARLLYHNGSDGIPNPGTGWATLGASGTDDLVLSPSDPGYYDSIASLTGPTPQPTLDQLTASQGAFVDLGWGMKTRINAPPATTVVPTLTPPSVASIFRASLSGVEGVSPALSLRKSGRVFGAGTGPFIASLYQPCFDSYSEVFEHDGFRQRPTPNGTIFTDGTDYVSTTAANLNPAMTDLASNGLDDDSNGLIDDYVEQDSSPPILSAMPAVQALIRLEDSVVGVIQQIAVTHDLVN